MCIAIFPLLTCCALRLDRPANRIGSTRCGVADREPRPIYTFKRWNSRNSLLFCFRAVEAFFVGHSDAKNFLVRNSDRSIERFALQLHARASRPSKFVR
jgi:hypothetical protein